MSLRHKAPFRTGELPVDNLGLVIDSRSRAQALRLGGGVWHIFFLACVIIGGALGSTPMPWGEPRHSHLRQGRLRQNQRNDEIQRLGDGTERQDRRRTVDHHDGHHQRRHQKMYPQASQSWEGHTKENEACMDGRKGNSCSETVDVIANSLVLYLPFCSTLNKISSLKK